MRRVPAICICTFVGTDKALPEATPAAVTRGTVTARQDTNATASSRTGRMEMTALLVLRTEVRNASFSQQPYSGDRTHI